MSDKQATYRTAEAKPGADYRGRVLGVPLKGAGSTPDAKPTEEKAQGCAGKVFRNG